MIAVKTIIFSSENYLQNKTAAFSDVIPCSLVVCYTQKQWPYVSPFLLCIYVVILSSWRVYQSKAKERKEKHCNNTAESKIEQ